MLATGFPPIVGCSDFAPADDTCQRVNCDNSDDGPDLWSCLGAPAGDRPTPGGTVTYEIPIVDYITQSLADGLVVQLCNNTDVSCNAPNAVVPRGVDNAVDDGIRVQLAQGFGEVSFIRVLSTSVTGTVDIDLNGDGMTPDPDVYIPYAYYFGDTVFTERVVQPNFQLLRVSNVDELATGANITLDQTRALTIVRAYDCLDNPAEGVTFRITYVGDDGGDLPQPFTVYNGLPFTPDERTDFLVTDRDGQGGFANVPFGNMQVFASINGQEFGPVTATAARGQITAVEVHARRFGRPIDD